MTPWPHQVKHADWIKHHGLSALWWQMRTGKTLTAIMGTDDGTRLIVCPNTVKPVWEAALKEYGDKSIFTHGKKNSNYQRESNYIINYESVWRADPFKYGRFDSVIFDESLRIHNPNAAVCEYLLACRGNKELQRSFQKWERPYTENLAKSKRIVRLSGTPCPEGYWQLVTQEVIGRGKYEEFDDPCAALRHYYHYDDERREWVINDWHTPRVKKLIFESGTVLSQADVGINTKKLYQLIEIEMGSSEQKAWSSFGDETNEPAQRAYRAWSSASARTTSGSIKQSNKLDAVAAYAIELGKQFIILTHFRESLFYLERKLTEAGVAVGSIYGGDHGSEFRYDLIEQFNQDRLTGLLANETTVKVGLNLSKADTLIFAENSWSGEDRIQAEERCTVMGKSAVHIVDFVTVGSHEAVGMVDKYVLESVREKKNFNALTLRQRR